MISPLIIVVVVLLIVVAGLAIIYRATGPTKQAEVDWMANDGSDSTLTPELEPMSLFGAKRVRASKHDSNAGEDEPLAGSEENGHGRAGAVLALAFLALKHPVGRKKRPLAIPLAWLLVAAITFASGWSIDFSYNWPPQQAAKNSGLIPTPPPKPKSEPKSAKAAKRQAERYQRAKERYQRDLGQALEDIRHPVHIPVWWLVLGLPMVLVVVREYLLARNQYLAGQRE